MRITPVLLCLLLAGSAIATNGMNMISYGARSAGMAGADAAVLTDASGVSGNPAVMGKTSEQSIAAGISLLMPQLNVSNDNMGLDIEGESQVFPLPSLAFATRAGSDSPWIIGIEAYAQGGMGVDFQNFPTSATTSDELMSSVMFMRLTGSVGYQVSNAFSLGLSAMAGYAGMDFSMFPESQGGIDVEGLSDIGYAGKIGMHYKMCDKISLGAVYTTETALDMDGGTATLNFGSQSGKVEYDARMIDFNWPAELEFGIALKPGSRFLIAADAKMISWSSAMEVVGLEVSSPPDGFPGNPFPNGQGGYTNTSDFQMNWEDQWVYALGVEYSINPVHAVRAGFNYGKSPVPDEYLSPLFPAIVEQHATLGYGASLGKWNLDFAWEHGFENGQTNNNTDLTANPFGQGITVDHSQNTIHFQTSYSF